MQIPVVIQAGGRGIRMESLTEVLPKPLVPINDKTMVELVLEQFDGNIYMIINYMADLIEAYLKNKNITFIKEKKYRGTAGALKLLDIEGDFLLSNCDILVDADYDKIIDSHRKNRADMTIVATRNKYNLPYGIFDYTKDNRVSMILEKPEYTHVINTGFYIINSNMVSLIDTDYMDMNDLIQKGLNANRRIFLHHIENDKYTDMGTLDSYKKFIKGLE